MISVFTCVGALPASAAFLTFEASNPYDFTFNRMIFLSTVDNFRAVVGGGSFAGPNGSFGGLRREINWDGVPGAFSDPNPLPANFFNSFSTRGVQFSTPGTGFRVSANAGDGPPILFGESENLQTFSSQKLFTIVGSPVMDINFFMPGSSFPATTSAFGVVFVDAEDANQTKVEFFDPAGTLIFSHFALSGANRGLTFLGAVGNAGERISRVRITASDFLDLNSDLVVMDDFIYAEPIPALESTPGPEVPEPASFVLVSLGLLAASRIRRPQA